MITVEGTDETLEFEIVTDAELNDIALVIRAGKKLMVTDAEIVPKLWREYIRKVDAWTKEISKGTGKTS